ncbi:MAG: L-seryl-tRNA(Sec) selenium transferase, partial [Synergistaceae bacterium]|nr:L-seryl-tRNA(Sec) selenium transferase [Synergistaceae bacterium]
MNEDVQQLLKKIPSMDLLLGQPWVLPLEEELGREAVKALFADVMNEIRAGIRSGGVRVLNTSHIIEEARRRMEARALPSLVKVVNATGVVVHTNMGRSCLGKEAIEAVSGVASGYSTLEYSLETGSRGHRNAHVEWLLCQLTGAEAALVVNNNAGAVILCLAALAREREVVISRGELVEIGGSFRIPDIMSFSGAHMVEVGATNRTHLWDYERVIREETAMLLKVHPSNFKIQGFCGSVSRKELAALA